MPYTVQFVPFSSFLEPGFWSELTRLKLHEFQLDDSPKAVLAYFSNSDSPGVPARVSFGFSALDPAQNVPINSVKIGGTLLLMNTIEEFKSMQRNEFLLKEGQEIWSSIQNERCFQDTSSLNRCLLTVFADLKKYQYFYWFAYPALCFPDNLTLVSPAVPLASVSCDILTQQQISDLPKIVASAFSAVPQRQSVFLLKIVDGSCLIRPFAHLKDSDFAINATFLVVSDPSTNENHPGWPLRNALAAWAYHRRTDARVRVICWRQRFLSGKVECGHSLFLEISFSVPTTISFCPKVVGWEKNEKGMVGPRFVDMSSSLDPVRLAENAVNLNLQLMRWRLVPELDLDRIRGLRCLLFGAGTLGCNVARCLLAWGVHHITFVDNAKVSYSNPVRQSLFRFKDSLNGGRQKAKAAADALLEIVPSASVAGHEMTVPMPGHVISENEETEVRDCVDKIVNMVKEHDVVFLLMDTREGRWLPTLLATFYSKLAFSVALGFDSYVVIRHGWRPNPTQISKDVPPIQDSSSSVSLSVSGDQLGCYFCCDVTAPGNSARDRSLDQQCTVTRPGVSVMAASLAVEILSSLMQHPGRGLASAATPQSDSLGTILDDSSEDESCLGSVPHQIRGYVSRFQQITPCVQRFRSCVACSELVMTEYKNRGWEFLRDVFNSPKSLEKITGLDELQGITGEMEVWELSDTDSVKSMESS